MNNNSRRVDLKFTAILIVAMGFREMNNVHPMPSPTFAVLRLGKQRLHYPLIGIRAIVVFKSTHFFGSRRQTQ